ncbi:MAG: hypothetical protein Q4B54_13050, partial [Coriobacteriales bacterium]|nr:hypothetical protein [Coriobacteriales bacterium]
RSATDDSLTATEVNEAISYDRLMRAFGPMRRETVMDEAIEEPFGKILKVCSAYQHPISQRSQIMMRDYIATASQLMERDATDDRLAPLDYAISQKVLPAIAGAAEQYDEFLQRLDEQCAALPLTHGRLKHIMDYGASSGYYQFFV